MKVKTSELSGAALDWAVAQVDPMCNGLKWKVILDGRAMAGMAMIGGENVPCGWICNGATLRDKLGFRRDLVHLYSPSTDWSQGGPLIEQFAIEFYRQDDGSITAVIEDNQEYRCMTCDCTDATLNPSCDGESHLIAACRAIVVAKLGDQVDVPDELVEV